MTIKHIEDYYEEMQKQFPDIPLETIDKVMKFGLRSFYYHNVYGGDVLIKMRKPFTFTMYCGKFFKNTLSFLKYRELKMRIKLRIKYKREKPPYSGYYYFGLSDDMFEYYKSQMKKSGRRRQKFHFKAIKFYKILEEVTYSDKWNHVFKIPYPEDVGFTIFREDFITRDFEYILKRNKETKKFEPVSYEERNK